MDRFSLFNAFINQQVITLKRHDGTNITGRIVSMELEDGSGYLFNVRIRRLGESATEVIFARCVKP
jgi:hypothetical protein